MVGNCPVKAAPLQAESPLCMREALFSKCSVAG